MAESRWTSHPSVTVDCPVCDRPLPRVVVDVDARADVDPRVGSDGRRGRVLLLTVQAQTLDPAWWVAARAEHPDCIPAEDPPTLWCDACELHHRCLHCHDDPPRESRCSHCGRMPALRAVPDRANRYPYAGPHR